MRNNTDQAVRSKDKATAVMVKYKLGRHQFEFDINEKRYNENATITGRFSSYKNRAWLAIWDARWSDAWQTCPPRITAGPKTATHFEGAKNSGEAGVNGGTCISASRSG